MAEGGGSFKGSDAFYDYNCSDCLGRNNAFTEAVFFCPECNKYLCKNCSVCGHDVIGRRNLNKWGKPSTRLQFDPCPSHKANVIQLYCKKHDVVCCPVCAQTDHKLCGELNYIPLVASAKGNKSSLQNVKKNLLELQTKADKLGKDRTTRLTGLDNTEKQLIAAVKAYRAKLDALLDDLQQQSIEDIKQYMATLSERYKSELALSKAIETESADLQKKLDAAFKDEALMFSRLKQGIEQIEDKTHLISDITSSDVTDKAQFVPHSELEQQVKSLYGLGELLTDPPISTIKTSGLAKVKKSQGLGLAKLKKSQGQGLEKVTRSQGQGLDSQHVPLNRPYTVKSKTSVSVESSEDEDTCDISGMCQMADGSIIVVNNQSLKQLDSTYKVTSHCSLTDCPCDVCPTEAGQVAVALHGKTIQLVSVGRTMTRTKCFSTDHGCYSLTYTNNCLYVVDQYNSTIHVYNLSGTPLHTISSDQHGNHLFTDIQHITASPDGARLYITDLSGLVTVDTKGNLLARFTSPDLEDGGYAVCVDRSDNVFVGGAGSDNVLQVEKGERQLAEIISQSDKIEPMALCFDGVNLTLLVSVRQSDTVHVLHLSK